MLSYGYGLLRRPQPPLSPSSEVLITGIASYLAITCREAVLLNAVQTECAVAGLQMRWPQLVHPPLTNSTSERLDWTAILPREGPSFLLLSEREHLSDLSSPTRRGDRLRSCKRLPRPRAPRSEARPPLRFRCARGAVFSLGSRLWPRHFLANQRWAFTTTRNIEEQKLPFSA
ncbi:hypothetical protein K523DRAFT_126134 [Schizophyllum commune Tattone D]|nr:hypothetical protein K523DRAFT_126134 [Schizophyllum commune Tattone D]